MSEIDSGSETDWLLLGDLEQLPVAAVCSSTDDHIYIGGAVVPHVTHLLYSGFLIEPTANTHKEERRRPVYGCTHKLLGYH